jgi:hypothetical protein
MASNEIGITLVVNGTQTVVKNIEDVQKAMVDLKKELTQTDLGTEAFDNVREELQKAGSAFKEFKNDTRPKEVKDQFSALGSGISESFSIAEDGLKSFGVESKAVSKVVGGATGAITLALRARELAELKVEAATAIRATTEKAAAAGTALLNGVNKALNLTLKANPIGLIVTAVGLLVVGFLMLINPIKKLISSFEPLNKAMEFTIGLFRDIGSFLTGGLIDDSSTAKTRDNADKTVAALDDVGSAENKAIAASKRKLALMQAQGATEEELLAQKKKINQQEVASRTAAINALIKLQQADGELDEDKKKKLSELQAELADLNNQALIDQAEYNKGKADKEKEAQEKAAEDAKAAADKGKEAAKKRREDALALNADALKKTKELENQYRIESIKDEQEKARVTLEIQQKSAQDELQLQIDTLKKKGSLTKEEKTALTNLNIEKDALIKKQGLETQTLLDEQAKVRKEKEAAFQKELSDINREAANLRINDQRELAKVQLEQELADKEAEINASTLKEEEKQQKLQAIRDLYAEKKKQQDTTNADEDRQKLVDQFTAISNDTTLSFETRKQALIDADAQVDEITNLTDEQRKQKHAEFTAAIAAIDMAALQAKAAITGAELDLVAQAGEFISQIAGKNKAAQIAGLVISKAASIGKIISATSIANAQSVAASPLTLGMPWVAINTASAALSIASTIAASAKAISEINSAGGGGGGGGNAPTPSKFAGGGYVSGPGTGRSDSIPAFLSNGESVINAQSTAMFGGLLSAINQAGGGKGFADGGMVSDPTTSINYQPPIIKTYVVASDVTNQQEADFKIEQLAKL